MEIPFYEPFYLPTSNALEAEIHRLGLGISLSTNLASLSRPLTIGPHACPNRWCAQPISGYDACLDGTPSERTLHRYRRLASGGFGLIWIESTRPGPETGRLSLRADTADAFRAMATEIRRAARCPQLLLVLQLAATGDASALSGLELAERQAQIVRMAALAQDAGFDGVDIQACHGSLAASLLRARSTTGPFGGTLENRARFLRECVSQIRECSPSLLLAVRLNAFEAVQTGFGVAPDDYRQPDLSEPVHLATLLRGAGLDLLNVTCASPNLRSPTAERPVQPKRDADPPDEHPLTSLDRQLRLAKALRDAVPGLPVVGSGFSWLRQFVPQAAAGAIDAGSIDIAGLGRAALAYPDAPADVLERGAMDAGSTCMVCFACSSLAAQGSPVGCPIRDPGSAGRDYRQMRRFSQDELAVGARRCHLCEQPPCVAACHTQVNIPVFIQAFRDGDEAGAYEIIRRHDVLPELTSHLSPGWLSREGACIETALSGEPVPILDLQYTVAWRARQLGRTGVRIPEQPTGRRLAIVGGGPAGIAAAARLLEHGHEVDLFETSNRLGGMPARLIPASRLPDPGPEIDALLSPALLCGRLRSHFGRTLGTNLALDELTVRFDAVLLATGLWRERSLGLKPGVVAAPAFLEAAKQGSIKALPRRVAILSGGDCAMDAAKVAKELGAGDVFVVFGGPRSAMHWHMPESWFATEGVHALMHCRPLAYETGREGKLTGLRIHHLELAVESVLPVELAIEAMGLEAAHDWKPALGDRVCAAGGLVNGGASVAQCVAEGLAAGDRLHAALAGT